MSHRTDHYAVLGVERTATHRQLLGAYRRLARELHPDANPDPRAAKAFARVSRAWAVLGDPAKRTAYDERGTWGRFARPGSAGPMSYQVEERAPIYHSDLGHHSDFYQAGDPLTVVEAAALVHRHAAWLRRAIRSGRLPAAREEGIYLLRRRDVERLSREAARRTRRQAGDEDAELPGHEGGEPRSAQAAPGIPGQP